MSYGTPYIDTFREHTRKGGKVNKMTKTTQTNEPKSSKKYAKTRGEHYKDIVIAVLVTAVVGFVAGMHFANTQNAQVQNAVKAVQTPAPATAKK